MHQTCGWCHSRKCLSTAKAAGSFSTNFKVTGKIIPVCIEAAQVIQTKKNKKHLPNFRQKFARNQLSFNCLLVQDEQGRSIL